MRVNLSTLALFRRNAPRLRGRTLCVSYCNGDAWVHRRCLDVNADVGKLLLSTTADADAGKVQGLWVTVVGDPGTLVVVDR